MSAREDLLKRLENIERSISDRSSLKIDVASMYHPPISAKDDIGLFVNRMKEAGGEVHVLREEEINQWIVDYGRKAGYLRFILSSDEMLAGTKLSGYLKANIIGSEIREIPVSIADAEARHELREYTERAQVGIQVARAGFVDTGSIAISASPKESRSLSLLTETHIAILRIENLYPSLFGYAKRMSDDFLQDKTSAWTIIGGPSKTADIEKVLITGVHGPRNFIVLLIRTKDEGVHA